jgi:hypothetical protein
MDAPTHYEIRIEGHLSASWASWFQDLYVRHEENGETVLSGTLVDQSALHGVLMRIRDLGLPLVAVSRTERTEDQAPEGQRAEEEEA